MTKWHSDTTVLNLKYYSGKVALKFWLYLPQDSGIDLLTMNFTWDTGTQDPSRTFLKFLSCDPFNQNPSKMPQGQRRHAKGKEMELDYLISLAIGQH